MKRLASLVAAVVMSCSSTVHAQWLSDWTEFNGHQYRVTAELDWFAAESLAESVGGHLVTIDDATENQWVLDTFGTLATSPSGLWIGLFQPDGSPEPAGGWAWISGDPFTFVNWDPNGEPNNNTIFGNENAANMWTTGGPPGTWNDFAGDSFFLLGVVELVPEPSTALLLAAGGTVLLRRRRR